MEPTFRILRDVAPLKFPHAISARMVSPTFRILRDVAPLKYSPVPRLMVREADLSASFGMWPY